MPSSSPANAATLEAKTTGPLIVPDSFTASKTFTVPITFTAAPTRGVRAAERDLQAGEVDDARRAGQRRDHRGAVGDVAVAARDAVGVELPQAVAGRAGEVERDDILALVQQPADNPCADATPGARDDVSLAHGATG